MSDDWRENPATEEQKEKLRFFGCTWNGDITAGQASDALEECRKQFPQVEEAYLRRHAVNEQPSKPAFQEVTIQQADRVPSSPTEQVEVPSRSAALQAGGENLALSDGCRYPGEPKRDDPKYQAWDNPAGREYAFALDHLRWRESVNQIKAQTETEKNRDSLTESSKAKREIPRPAPQEFTIPATEVQNFALHRGDQRPNYSSYSGHAIQQLERLLKDCSLADDCRWLPVSKAANLVNAATEMRLPMWVSRQIASQIQWAGYCVEPDARFTGASYDKNQTLGLFEPFDGESMNPSDAYLGVANLLRLCVLIAAADGQIDQVELDVFRCFIENQLGLSRTEIQRLKILEKLLVRDSSSAGRTLTKIARSVPAHKRLLIGKVLVRVAAADGVITKEERRALERIFKAFEILPDVLENLARDACSQPDTTSGERVLKQRAEPASKPFTLDMDRVYAITNETKEVVGILSVVMQDEQEKLPAEVTSVPTLEAPKISNENKTAPSPTQFDGLEPAFLSILECLLTRDSWPKDEFDDLARKFNFMPLKIYDTLNEWADDALGDFILDGDNPVVIHRDLIKKKIT